ncbi:phage antirepressor KilAC domain-containing protein [Sediminibacterium soli]|uniref:phage antirepressor KilAC domain-containing protein n=1 Tax=Sediminibacterium soli TaxID=2698829 RepID=UPI00137A0C22|nr:phage antirepressor KilAC domain-containing protein [Sediminibacterium soli]NCI45040.1 hypothetical protein [Sediminibacterium soli]
MEKVNYSMTELAVHLNITLGRYTIGRNVLMEHLRELKVLQTEEAKNKPFKEFYQHQFFDVITVTKNNRHWNKTVVTEKGIKWLQSKYVGTIKEREYQYWKDWYPDV